MRELAERATTCIDAFAFGHGHEHGVQGANGSAALLTETPKVVVRDEDGDDHAAILLLLDYFDEIRIFCAMDCMRKWKNSFNFGGASAFIKGLVRYKPETFENAEHATGARLLPTGCRRKAMHRPYVSYQTYRLFFMICNFYFVSFDL